MRREGLSRTALVQQAEARWHEHPDLIEGVLGPVVIQFTLGLGALSDATELEALLLAPRPEIVWLMGEMGTKLQLRPDRPRYPWAIVAETQTVWLTLPLLQGFLKALWTSAKDHNGVVEEWTLDEP